MSDVNDNAPFSKQGFLINIKILISIFILLSICTAKFINLNFCNYEVHLEFLLSITLILLRFYFSTLDYVLQFYSEFKNKSSSLLS